MNGPSLVVGATGQDGCYLVRHLIAQGLETHATSRGGPAHAAERLRRLGPVAGVQVHSLDPVDADAVDKLIAAIRPARIYYLAAQSSVWRSFAQPAATFGASVLGLYAVLESMRRQVPSARLVYAASGDCFGATSAADSASESHPFAPLSPYAIAKCAGAQAIEVARRAYGQFATSAFLFSHESPLRSDDFVTGKIVSAARRIAQGSVETLTLDTLDVVRDWGWAPDYVAAMSLILEADAPSDFVIASGQSRPLRDLVAAIFASVGLDWRAHVQVAPRPSRPTDIMTQFADPSKAHIELGWRPTVTFEAMAHRLVAAPGSVDAVRREAGPENR